MSSTVLRRHPRPGLRHGVLLAVLVSCALPATALAGARARVVTYRGLRLTVPAAWPVYRLGPRSTTCVRFDRHALYLGAPSADQRCPAARAAGRTEALLVQPQTTHARPALPLPTRPGATPGGRGSGAQIVAGPRHAVVTATWNRNPALIARALGIGSPASAAARGFRVRRPSAVFGADAVRRARAHATAAAVAQPGQIYTGAGIDACHTPSAGQMAAWSSSSYRAIGVYIGGANMACSQPNLSASWVSAESGAGWHLVPIYVGLQAPSNSCGCAAMSAVPATASSEGTAAADDAITDAQAIAIGAGNPLYLDMEGYGRTSTNTAAVLAFVAGWTTELHAHRYASGVYASLNSGVADLVAQQTTCYPQPDEIWFAAWNGYAGTTDPSLPSLAWASHQRLHQYAGGHNETYGGVTINVDGDYLDAPTAAAGTGPGVGTTASCAAAPSPSLTVTPGSDGTIALSPSWPYEGGVSSWQLMGGASPSSLAPLGAPVPAGHSPIVVNSAYPYFAVSGVAATGQILGSSTAVATPSHVAIFGRSIFSPRTGLIGVPIGCYNPSPCSVTTTIALGNSLVARTKPERAGGGGIAYFVMNAADHKLLQRRHRLAVQVTIRDASGLSASRTLTLTPFTTTGRSGPRSLRPSSAIRFIGTGDFASHGWVGGILAQCIAAAPCQATTNVVVGRQVVAHTGIETLGVGQVGYLTFTLTRAGHNLLMHAPGNQLPARVSISVPGGGTAFGRLVLSAY